MARLTKRPINGQRLQNGSFSMYLFSMITLPTWFLSYLDLPGQFWLISTIWFEHTSKIDFSAAVACVSQEKYDCQFQLFSALQQEDWTDPGGRNVNQASSQNSYQGDIHPHQRGSAAIWRLVLILYLSMFTTLLVLGIYSNPTFEYTFWSPDFFL